MRRTLGLEIAGILAITGALAGFVSAQLLPRTYISRTAVAFTEKVAFDRCAFAAGETLSETALKPVVLQSAYFQQELDFTPTDEIVQRIRQNGAIRCGDKNDFEVEFSDADRYLTLEMIRILVEQTGKNAGAPMKIVEPVHTGMTGPSPALCVLAGTAAGLLLGLLTLLMTLRH